MPVAKEYARWYHEKVRREENARVREEHRLRVEALEARVRAMRLANDEAERAMNAQPPQLRSMQPLPGAQQHMPFAPAQGE